MNQGDLNRILAVLGDMDGSDVHLKVGSAPRLRVNGKLLRLESEPIVLASEMEALVPVIMQERTRLQFEEDGEVDFAYSVEGVGRYRANVFRQRGSVGLILRRVRPWARSFTELGLPDVVRTLAEERRGLVLVTGPAGSGKTTTLAAMVDHINHTRECHVVTIEDPIEVLHDDDLASITQREVGFDTRTFASAMRSALREDPDVILVGEMRDLETVETALSAAETGHFVVSTLHTVSALETVNRVVDFFPPDHQLQARRTLAGVLRGTICQRLVPTSDGSARVPALEVMIVNGRIQQCIVEPGRTTDIAQIIAEGDFYGMQSFDQALVDLYEQGTIDLRAAMVAASNAHDLRIMLQRRGLARGVAVSS
jgi:twitching motility protein PilT